MQAVLFLFYLSISGINNQYFYDNLTNPRILELADSCLVEDEIIWGLNTENIRERVRELCEESSMFNQIYIHLSKSNLPFSIISKQLESVGGMYSSKNGLVILDESKYSKHIFDATIIEEFVHAYQSLFYNYSHGILKHREIIRHKKNNTSAVNEGLKNWMKYGRKTAFIESEAKLLTFFIQHQTCSISLDDIYKVDNLNTGGKGRRLITRYLERKVKQRYRRQKMGHLNEFNQIEINVFSNYQKLFINHWIRERGPSSYTKGYFFHKPEALNKVYEKVEYNRFKTD